jgi:sn-glycerol 3-phosphate transport system permease protein
MTQEAGALGAEALKVSELDELVPSAPRGRSRRAKEIGLAFLLLLPSLIIFGVFVYYPLVTIFYRGLYESPPFPNAPSEYVGLSQYVDVLTGHDFLNSLEVTFLFALYTVPIGIALGILMAVLANQRLRGIAIFRTIFSSTVATSVAVASVIFFTLLNPQVGLFTYWLEDIIDTAQGGILQDPDTALIAVSVTTIWQNLGLTFILMIAGLQSIPDDLYEAASIDGAGPFKQFFRVTLPMLSPTIFFAAVVGLIVAFQSFGQIDILTQGGPIDKTNVLTYFIYTAAFEEGNSGLSSVLAVALFGIVLVLTLVQFRVLERRVFYGD